MDKNRTEYIPALAAGFEEIEETARYMAVLGTLSLYKARKLA